MENRDMFFRPTVAAERTFFAGLVGGSASISISYGPLPCLFDLAQLSTWH